MAVKAHVWYGNDITFPDLPHEPLRKLVGPASRVVIAFDDCALPTPPMARPDAREVIKVLLDELRQAGAERHNITLLSANALHRKWTRSELRLILGSDIVDAFGPNQFVCHDAEDPEGVLSSSTLTATATGSTVRTR